MPSDIGDYPSNGNGGLTHAGGVTVVERPPQPAQLKPPPGEDTARQDVFAWNFGYASWGSDDPSNPCGFENWGSLYHGNVPTYRFMRRHPTIAHVRRQVFAAILSNSWGWEALPGCPAGALELCTAMFTAEFRLKTWAQALYALDYGNSKFEAIWEVRDGRWWVTRLKPLAVDRNQILIDPRGNFVGIQYGAANEWLDRRKSFLFTYEGEAGNLNGEPRLENIRTTAWRDWLDASQQLQWITQKVAGKLCIITTPSGSYENAAGEKKSYRDAAMAAGKAIADPRSNGVIWFPTAALPDSVKKENIDLVKAPLVQIQVVDFGKYGDAIAPTLERLEANQGLMSAGYLRSPRTNQESKNGSRADAEEHSQLDIVDMELVDGQICMQFCEQIVDEVLEVNYGPKARGTVRARAGKMSDENLKWDEKVIDAVLLDPELRPQFCAGENGVDVDAIATRRNMPKKTKEIELEDTVDTTGDEAGPAGAGGAGTEQGGSAKDDPGAGDE